MKIQKRTILVTGGAGYIGSHTVVELIRSGYQVVIVDDFSNSNKKNLVNLFEICGCEIPVEKGSCIDEIFLTQVFKQYSIDAVIHFAAFKAVGESVAQPLKYYQNNISGLICLLKVMEKAHVSQLIFSSSCTVYGSPENSALVTENTPLSAPNSPYGWTKWMAEQIIRDTAKTGKLNAVLLRYFNPIGAHESGKIGELPSGVPNNIVPYMTQTAAGIRSKLTVFGDDYPTEDGTCIRDYIHVSDLAIAHIQALSIEANDEPEVFNLGTGKGTSVLELIHAFELATGKPLNWAFGKRRAGDVTEIYADVTKAKQILKWESNRNIQQAIEDAWRWEKYRLEHEIS